MAEFEKCRDPACAYRGRHAHVVGWSLRHFEFEIPPAANLDTLSQVIGDAITKRDALRKDGEVSERFVRNGNGSITVSLSIR